MRRISYLHNAITIGAYDWCTHSLVENTACRFFCCMFITMSFKHLNIIRRFDEKQTKKIGLANFPQNKKSSALRRGLVPY